MCSGFQKVMSMLREDKVSMVEKTCGVNPCNHCKSCESSPSKNTQVIISPEFECETVTMLLLTESCGVFLNKTTS